LLPPLQMSLTLCSKSLYLLLQISLHRLEPRFSVLTSSLHYGLGFALSLEQSAQSINVVSFPIRLCSRAVG